MPKKLPAWARSIAAAAAIGLAVAAGVALADGDARSAVVLAGAAALCAYALWRGKDPAGPGD